MNEKAAEAAVYEGTRGEKAKTGVFILIFGILFMAEVLFMDLCLIKAPDLIQMVYDKVTLPSSMLFVTQFKWLFQIVVLVLTCVPAALLMWLTGFGMSKMAGTKAEK